MAKARPGVPRYEHHGIRRHYLIFHQVGEDGIVILQLLNGAMDVEAILFPEG
jgi:toxin ParE1/3/4